MASFILSEITVYVHSLLHDFLILNLKSSLIKMLSNVQQMCTCFFLDSNLKIFKMISSNTVGICFVSFNLN